MFKMISEYVKNIIYYSPLVKATILLPTGHLPFEIKVAVWESNTLATQMLRNFISQITFYEFFQFYFNGFMFTMIYFSLLCRIPFNIIAQILWDDCS